MIHTALISLLAPALLMAGAAEIGPSKLVDAEHQHVWRLVLDNESGSAYLDVNWESTVEHDGRTYPVKLMRNTLASGSEEVNFDMTVAFDCEGKQMAIVKAWMPNANISEDDLVIADEMTFDLALTPPSEEDLIIISAGCDG